MMYVSTHKRRLEWAEVLHIGAGVVGIVLFVSWAGFVVVEALSAAFRPVPATYLQAATLAIVFAGYFVGWKHALAGGVMSLIGTALFFIASLQGATVAQATAASPAALFAVPGLMNLLAAHYGMVAKLQTKNMT